MAYTKVITIHTRLDVCVDYALDLTKASLSAAIDYALDMEKNETTYFQAAINCDLATAYEDMMDTKQRWGKRGDGHVQGYHIIQSFAPGETTPEQAHAVGLAFANRLLTGRYEVIVSTHLNKEHLHNHIVFNSVSFADGKMHRNNFRDYYGGDGVGIRGTSDALCREFGLSVIEPKSKGKHYAEWSAEKSGQPTIRSIVKADIDAIIRQAYTFQAFLDTLKRQGYTVKHGNVKHMAVRPPGADRFIRLSGLGADYTEEAIKRRIIDQRDGEPPRQKAETPPQKSPPAPSALPPPRKKLKGIQALYYRYLYQLGIIRKGQASYKTPFPLKAEVRRFHRYVAQFELLRAYAITDSQGLSMLCDALQNEIDAQTEMRRELYRAARGDSAGGADGRIAEINAALRRLRRDLYRAGQVEAHVPVMEKQLAETEQPARIKSGGESHKKTKRTR